MDRFFKKKGKKNILKQFKIIKHGVQNYIITVYVDNQNQKSTDLVPIPIQKAKKKRTTDTRTPNREDKSSQVCFRSVA